MNLISDLKSYKNRFYRLTKHISARISNAFLRFAHLLIVISFISPTFSWVSGSLSQTNQASNATVDIRPSLVPISSMPLERPRVERQQPIIGERPPLNIKQADILQTHEPDKEGISSVFPHFAYTESMLFTENMGQFDQNVRYRAETDNGAVHVTQDSVWITLMDPAYIPENDNTLYSLSLSDDGERASAETYRRGVNVRIHFLDANLNVTTEGIDSLELPISYFTGQSPNQWYVNVPVWRGVRYIDLYPGIDFEIFTSQSGWSWRLVLRNPSQFPGTEPNDHIGMRLSIDGADLIISESNQLRIQTSVGEIILPTIKAVQGDGTSIDLPPPQLEGNELVVMLSSGDLPGEANNPDVYAAPEELTLENGESLVFSTHLGGLEGRSIAVDALGYVYVAGCAWPVNFPVTPGAFQELGSGGFEGFILKLDPTGSHLLYATYLAGSGDDVILDITVGASGNTYVTGRTVGLQGDLPSDFPVTIGTCGTSNAFVTAISPFGDSLIYSRCIGGDGGEQGFSIALNQTEEVFAVGQTSSFDFPITDNAYDSSLGGSWDGYIVIIGIDGSLQYGSYLGGDNLDCEIGGDEKECTITLDDSENIYIAGSTYSTNFPTTLDAYDISYNGGQDGFVMMFSPEGSELLYSTYFGGSGDDCFRTCAIAVDSFGAAYVTGGHTITPGGDWNAFYAVVSPGGSDINLYSIGGASTDLGNDIGVDTIGTIYISGETSSVDFPFVAEAYQPFLRGPRDAFLLKLSPDGNVYYSSFLGGDGDEIGFGLALDQWGIPHISGWTSSGNFPTTPEAFLSSGAPDAFATKFSLVIYTQIHDLTTLLCCSTKGGVGDNRECSVVTFCGTQGEVGDPINSRTGGFDYAVSDLYVPTSAGLLVFQHSYSSLATNIYTSTMGSGWTHNHDTSLIFSDDPGGEPNTVLFKAHSANRYPFIDNGNGTYSPFPGLMATLERHEGSSVTYELIDSQQMQYIFDSEGKLQYWADAQGHTWTYLYNTYGKLERVSDDTALRYLTFEYDLHGRLFRVADHAGRYISFGYNPTGDLATYVDVLGQTWTYSYDGDHHLEHVIDPGNISVVNTEYDAQGLAYRQYDANGISNLEISYLSEDTTLIRDGLGNETSHVYDFRGTLISEVGATGGETNLTYGFSFRTSSLADPNDNVIRFDWSLDGANLTQVLDASGGQTNYSYDELNNLVAILDPLQYLSTYTYNGSLMTSSMDALSNTTIYSYTSVDDAPQPTGLLKSITDPLGHTTYYVYDQFGQLISATDSQNRTTLYGYDDLGRLERVTSPTGQTDWTCYDAAGRVIRTVVNATGDGTIPQTDPCDTSNYQPSLDLGYDRISMVIYDLRGNIIATIDPDGLITRTYYDANNRPISIVYNLYGQEIETPTPPVYDPNFPAQNVRNDTVYDNSGNIIATIDSSGIITRTYFDTENRPVSTVQNLVDQDITNLIPPTHDPIYPDKNVRSDRIYDLAGNLIASIDPNGIISRTYYDASNRPVTAIINLYGQGIAVPIPPVYDPNYPDRNVRSDTVYDLAGNAIAMIDTLGCVTRTYFDALNRPIAVVQNLYGWAIENGTPPSFDPTYPDRNVLTEYVYDIAGQQIAVIDSLGIVTRTYYDLAGRSYLVVQNLYGQSIENPIAPIYDPNYPDRNIRTVTLYDDDGRVIATVDNAGSITRTYYDQFERPYLIVRNLVGQSIADPTPPVYNPSYPDQNVRNETVYDENGKTIATIANDETINRTYYDELHRPVFVVRNLVGQPIEAPIPPVYNSLYPDQNLPSQTIYGPGGRVLQTIDANGQVVYTCYDGLGRTVKTIINPSITDPCGSYIPSSSTDLDIITTAAYDAAGRRVLTIDPNGNQTSFRYDALGQLISETDSLLQIQSYTYDGKGRQVAMTNGRGVVTRYEYDALGRMTTVIENYVNGVTPTHEVNVRTEYSYNASGFCMTIRDAVWTRLNYPIYTSFQYDALGRLVLETDPDEHAIIKSYDAGGNMAGMTDGNGSTTYFEYDGLERITLIDYPDPDTDVSYEYDAAGNKVGITDRFGITSWTYDSLNHPVTIDDPLSGPVSYSYDGIGHRTTLTYPDSREVNYSYDLAGRLHEVTGLEMGTTAYTYDRAGHLQSITNPNGTVSSISYDTEGQLLGLIHASDVETIASYQYTYNEVGNRESVTETLLLPTPNPDDLVFADGFESGNISAWHAYKNGSEIGVNTLAAMEGVYGLSVLINDDEPVFVTDWSPLSEIRYRARFIFDLNSISMASGDEHYLLIGYNKEDIALIRIEVRFYRGAYQVRAGTVKDSGQWANTLWYTISDARHVLEFDWHASSAQEANDGSFSFWIDDVKKASLKRIDNDTLRVDYMRLGAVDGLDVGTLGTEYFDGFESNRLSAIQTVTTTISYTYDPLNRLTSAEYSDGSYMRYKYNEIGSRVEEETTGGTIITFEVSNGRTVLVDGVNLAWDNNGNLLSDGVNSYSYDYANRLTSVSGPAITASFAYNGLGDRLQQTVNGTTITYTLDLAAGLTQVLADGTYTYTFGNGRIAQYKGNAPEYFITDALGSVRQLTDASASVTLAKDYQPYGEALGNVGIGSSTYGFSGEQASIPRLIYLRARYYIPALSTFMSKDVWEGTAMQPMSYNKWLYVYANPINYTDPSGHTYCDNPYADPYDCGNSPQAPNVSDYDETIPPPNIVFSPSLDTLSAGSQGIPHGHNAAQFIPFRGREYFNLCGQVSLSAILRVNVKVLLERWHEAFVAQGHPLTWYIGENDTDPIDITWASELRDFTNHVYGTNWNATVSSTPGGPWNNFGTNYYNGIQNWLSNQLVIVPVKIAYGSRYYDASGKLGARSDGSYINHWVVITGISTPFITYKADVDSDISPYNWIRIYNPFDNQTEYYWWGDFIGAANYGSTIHLTGSPSFSPHPIGPCGPYYR